MVMINPTESQEQLKIAIIYGSIELKKINRFENGRMVTYGYAIHRDKYGKITKRTEPERLLSIGWDNGEPLTEKEYYDYNNNVKGKRVRYASA